MSFIKWRITLNYDERPFKANTNMSPTLHSTHPSFHENPHDSWPFPPEFYTSNLTLLFTIYLLFPPDRSTRSWGIFGFIITKVFPYFLCDLLLLCLLASYLCSPPLYSSNIHCAYNFPWIISKSFCLKIKQS